MKYTPWRTILVVVGDPFAMEQPAAAKAAAIARRCGARLVLLNTFMVPEPVNDVPLGDHRLILVASMAHRRERLQQIARQLRLPGRVRCEVHWEYPEHEAILHEVQKSRPDVVMMASHRHGHIARWLLRNSDWELIRACPCPVWFVRRAELKRGPRLLVSIDPMHRRAKSARLDTELLRTATALGSQLRGSVDALHVCESVADVDPAQAAAAMAKARRATLDLAKAHGIAPENCSVAIGDPASAIARAARRDPPDVLVMGALSRSELGRNVVGRTAERVLDDVDCDVLIVKQRTLPAKRTQRPSTNKARRVSNVRKLERIPAPA